MRHIQNAITFKKLITIKITVNPVPNIHFYLSWEHFVVKRARIVIVVRSSTELSKSTVSALLMVIMIYSEVCNVDRNLF